MAPTGEQNPGGNPDPGAERKLGQGDRVILKGYIVNERNGVARVQVCRQLVYCMTDELEEDRAEDSKALTRPPLTRAVSGPGATKAKS